MEERPPEADGTRFGDFEMDTVIGRDGKGAIPTITDMLLRQYIPKKADFILDSAR